VGGAATTTVAMGEGAQDDWVAGVQAGAAGVQAGALGVQIGAAGVSHCRARRAGVGMLEAIRNGVPVEMAALVTTDGSIPAESGSAMTEIACINRQSRAMVKVPKAIVNFGVDKVKLLVRASECVCVIEKFGFVCAM
jgi:hypothetical protein